MYVFNSYVKLPEGITNFYGHNCRNIDFPKISHSFFCFMSHFATRKATRKAIGARPRPIVVMLRFRQIRRFLDLVWDFGDVA